jgi:hypothetical protein
VTATTLDTVGKPPADGPIQIAFDRLLNPATVTRQTVVLKDGSGNVLTPVIEYDPVDRVVSLRPPAAPAKWLVAEQIYEIDLTLPSGPDDDFGGIRALDRATLDPGDTHLKLGFVAGAAGAAPIAAAPTMNFCNDILPVLANKCATVQYCHLSETPMSGKTRFGDLGLSLPAQGLILDTSIGVANTALKRIANEANTGAGAGVGTDPGPIFAVDMPLIAPGNPGNSFLLYKVLLSELPTTAQMPQVRMPCDPNGVPQPPQILPSLTPFNTDLLSDSERAILADNVLGREMPYPSFGADGTAMDSGLTIEELRRLRLWIQQGAVIKVDCGACQP